MNSPQKDFYIIVQIDGNEKHVNVKHLETTDGVPYYACYIGKTEITQIRDELYGKWEQLWGSLPEETVQAIGKQIEEEISPNA